IFALDVLVLITAMEMNVKVTESIGDYLAGFEPDPLQTQLDAFFSAADPHAAAQSLLDLATTRILYDVDSFQRTRAANPADPGQWQPAYAATLSREIHVSDLPAGQTSPVSIAFSYSDGLGHEVQKKIHAEPGPLSV